ncbi:MAG: hypothetical protein GYB31_03825 [Bacteroidetes bacterium]|nr:hypothetical protein [Bacteroidota bacterium]
MLLLLLTGCQSGDTDYHSAPEPKKEEIITVCSDSSLLKKRHIRFAEKEGIWQLEADQRAVRLNDITLIRWYFSGSCDQLEVKCDSLVLKGTDLRQVLKPEKLFVGKEKIKRFPINFDDYNFDGYKDFRIYSNEDDAKNIYYSYYLFDRQEEKYLYSGMLSQLSNLQTDSNTGLLQSFTNDAPSGMEHTARRWRFQGDHLEEVWRQKQYYDARLNLHIVELSEWRENRLQLIARDTIRSH